MRRSSSGWNAICDAIYVVLPGVGAADACMAGSRENGPRPSHPRLTQPLIGICVGMQLLF